MGNNIEHMNLTEQYRYYNILLDQTTDPSEVARIIGKLNMIESRRLFPTLISGGHNDRSKTHV